MTRNQANDPVFIKRSLIKAIDALVEISILVNQDSIDGNTIKRILNDYNKEINENG